MDISIDSVIIIMKFISGITPELMISMRERNRNKEINSALYCPRGCWGAIMYANVEKRISWPIIGNINKALART